MFVATILIFLCTMVLYFFLTSGRKRAGYMRNVPGPKSLFLFGNTLDFLFKPTYEWLDIFMKYEKLYGGVVYIRDGPFTFLLMVSDPKFVEYILSSNKLIDKSFHYKYMHNWIGNGLIATTGSKWKTYRRILTPAFHFSILDNFLNVFNNVGGIFVEKLKKEVDKSSVEISNAVGLCTLDAVAEAAMGIKLDAQTNASSYVKNTRTMGNILLKRFINIIPPSLYPLTPSYFIEKRITKEMHDFVDDIIRRRIARRKEHSDVKQEGKLAFLDLLLSYTLDGKPLPMLDVREEVDTFMFAGHDTTAATITFAMYCLANHPDVQEKAYQEQRELFGDVKSANVTGDDIKRMKYLENVIKETLRLYPSVPILGRELPEDVEWGGNLYPKGATIMISPYVIHRNAKNFPDPCKFKPDRFENLQLDNPYVYIPFSAGPRNCIGQKFAMLEIKSVLSKVLRNFELYPATPQHVPRLSPDAILTSSNGVRISFSLRN